MYLELEKRLYLHSLILRNLIFTASAPMPIQSISCNVRLFTPFLKQFFAPGFCSKKPPTASLLRDQNWIIYVGEIEFCWGNSEIQAMKLLTPEFPLNSNIRWLFLYFFLSNLWQWKWSELPWQQGTCWTPLESIQISYELPGTHKTAKLVIVLTHITAISW